MRLIGAASLVFALGITFALSGLAQDTHAEPQGRFPGPQTAEKPKDGQAIFRFDTFGDEQLWTDVLRMHEVIPAFVDPATALAVGLKVDVEALPPALIAALQAGDVDLGDPAVTVELLRLNAVVGVKGTVNDIGQLTSVGITCALCHSSVDDSFAPGIGKRLDGWANIDLDVGAIAALSPALDPATKAEFNTWGPGMYDPRHHYFDGNNIVLLNTPSLPIVIPPIYGLRGVGFETFSADGPISYWNAYVGIGQMGGQGAFHDPRVPPSGIFITQGAGSGHPEAAGVARLSIAPAHAGTPERQLRSTGRESPQTAVPQRGRLRYLPPRTAVHRRLEWADADGAIPARSGGGRHGGGICLADRHRQIPNDAVTRTLAASAVFP
jgi:hypothetical protein